MDSTSSDDEQATVCLLPANWLKRTDWNKCVIRQANTRETVSCATLLGVTKFQNAMKQRNYDISERLESESLSEKKKFTGTETVMLHIQILTICTT